MLDSTVVLESGGVGLICRATLRCRALILEPKQLLRKMKSHLLIIKCAGYIFWQLLCGNYSCHDKG